MSPHISTQNVAVFSTGVFHKNSLIVAYCTLGKLKIRTLTPKRFKNQTNDTFKLNGHNCKYQQGFVKQKIVAPYHYGFKLKFLKHIY